MPLISVVIPNFNGEKFLVRCLNSVLAEKRKAYEVVIVDDGSTDSSVKLVKELTSSRVKLIENKKNIGAAEARNIGVKNSQGKYLLFLDNDTKIKKGWFDEVVRFFKENKKAGLAQAKILKMGTNKFDCAGNYLGPFGFLIEPARGAADQGQFDQEDKIFAAKSAAMLARRKVFEKLGGFDADYKIFWEDTDLSWRTWLFGFELLFAPKIVVWHAYGTKEKGMTPYGQNQVYYRGCKNTIASLIKNLGRKRLAFILPVNLGCWLILAIGFFLRLEIRTGLSIVKGVLWNIIYFPQTLRKRKKIQAKRKISDQELLTLVGAKRGIAYYLGKGLAYVTKSSF